MNHPLFFRLAALALFTLLLTSCQPDRGPYEDATSSYALSNFDQLDMGSAFKVDVRAGGQFAVDVRGDRNDIDDLKVSVRNGTLYAEYRNHTRKQRYGMTFTITMPTLRAVNFSGAAQSTVNGFANLTDLAVTLSGASTSTVNVSASRLAVKLSGASAMTSVGSGRELWADLSGASRLKTVDYPVDNATLDLSGASNAHIRVTDALTVKASGASKVQYRGAPRVSSNVSGASTVSQE